METDPHYTENKFLSFIRRGINAKYSLPAWLWVLLSFVVGVLVFIIAVTNPATSAAFFAALPFTGILMGPLVAIAAAVAMYGMATGKIKYVKWGSFSSFCLWLFVGFALFMDGGIISFLLLPLPLLVFWAYKYLASWVREIDGV